MYYFENPQSQAQIKEFFVNKPLSFLNGPKLEHIIFIIRKFNLKNILEVGTFAGGTTYLLAKEFPNCQITTIDLNNFEEYFKQYDHKDKILASIKSGYPEVDIQETSVVKIQEIYKSLSPNATFITGDLTSMDITDFDAVIIDGDHTVNGLLSDLKYCHANMKSGIIFVDDCAVDHIQRCCESFCIANSLDFKFEVYCDYGNSSGYDLCVIRKH